MRVLHPSVCSRALVKAHVTASVKPCPGRRSTVYGSRLVCGRSGPMPSRRHRLPPVAPTLPLTTARSSRLRYHLLRRLLLDLLHVLLEEPLVDVHHVDLATLDIRLLDIARHIQRRPRRDQQRAFLAHFQ